MNIFELVGMIAIENGDANKAIDDTSNKARAFSTAMKKGITDAAKWGAGIATAAAAAAVAITNEIKKIVSDAASMADTIDKASDRIGFSTQAYQEWDYVLNLCGTSAETLESGMKALQEKMYGVKYGSEEAIRIFDDLGVSCYDLNGEMKDAEVIFEEIIYKLASMTNESERSQLAQKAFSEGGAKFANMLNQGTAGIDAMRESFRELGIEMNEEDIAAGVVYTDTAYMLKRAVDSIKNDFGMTVMPYLTDLANGLLEKIPEIKKKLAEWEPTIQATLDKIFDGLNWIIENPDKVGDALEAIGVFFGLLFAATHPVEASVIAIGAGIIALVNAFSGGNSETKKFEKTMSELDSAFYQTMQDIEDEYIEADTLIDVLEELAGKTTLTAEETAKWEAAVNRMEELLPGFKESVDNETSSIIGGTDAIRERIKAIKDQAIEEAKATYLKDKYNAVAAAYAATGKLQLDIETQRNIWANRDLEVQTAQERYDALQAKVDEYERQDRYAPYDLLNERDIAYSEWRTALKERAEAGKELTRLKEDLETLLPAIQKAEEELAAAEKAISGGAEGLESTLTGAAEALESAAATLAETEVDPNLSANAEGQLQGELNGMDLTVAVHPHISGRPTYSNPNGWRSEIPGHAEGLDYVPYDNYVARLHRGEKVLTANEASAYRSGEGSARMEEAINRLYAIMCDVLNAIKEGQVIQLDTGALVGQTAGAMNDRLGALAVRSGRRN